MHTFNQYKFIFLVGIMATSVLLTGQTINISDEAQHELSKSSEFSIPVSPAFTLLEVDPSLVPKPGIIRDFKVDWSFRSYGLSPNLAIQSQPFWEIYFNSPQKMTKYKSSSKLLKFLSTLDVSAGTIEGNNDIQTNELIFKDIEGNDSIVTVEKNWKIRSFAYALKINLYKEKDPLENTKLFVSLLKEYEENKTNLKNQIKELKVNFEKVEDIEEKISLREEIKQAEIQYNNIETTYLEKMKKRLELYKKESWNTSYIDLAYGQAFDFDSRDSSLFTFKNLRLVNKKLSIWVSSSKGIGKHWLISSLIRLNMHENVLVNRNSINLDLGLNMRYGNSVYNFFIETYIPFFYDKIQGSIMNFSYGGDWRVSRNVILNYGLRTQVDDNLKLVNILPVVSVSCLMR